MITNFKIFENLTNNFFLDLLDVGTKKALGYLPLSTIKTYGGNEAKQELINFAIENNLKYAIYLNGSTASGALYIWNEKCYLIFC